MIKALFFDIDGTLLDDNRKITPKTRTALDECKNSNIKLYIATARPPLLDRMLSWDDSTLSLFSGGVFYNGGCILLNDEKLYTFIPADIVQAIIQCVGQYDTVNIALQMEHEKHAFRFPLEENGYKSWGVSADEALTLNQAGSLQTVKILVFYSNLIDSVKPIEKNLVTELEKLCFDTAQFYLTDNGRCIQIMAKSIHKVKGIERIRIALRIDKNELAVFGDDIPDLEMISEYENSIAMDNALELIKNAAKYVTLDNNSDGIYHAIHNILHLV